jgi:hypothetical protein
MIISQNQLNQIISQQSKSATKTLNEKEEKIAKHLM